MKLSILPQELRDAVSKTVSIVDRKNSRPILSYCMIGARDDGLIEIGATDLDVNFKITIPASIEIPGSFCIEPKSFLDILREMPPKEITLEINENKNLLLLTCENIRFSLLVLETESFPILSFNCDSPPFVLTGAVFQKLFNMVFHAVSADETRPAINGVFIHKIRDGIRSVATDGHRIAIFDHADPSLESTILVDGMIISKKGVHEIKKFTDACYDEEIEFKVDHSFLYLKDSRQNSLSIRLIARDFLNYQVAIPVKTTYSFDVEKITFLNSLKRVKLLAYEKSNAITFQLTRNQLVFKSYRVNMGDVQETIDCNYNEDHNIEISFNAKYLLDLISTIEGQRIVFEFNNEFSPVIVRGVGMSNFFGIIGPLKV